MIRMGIVFAISLALASQLISGMAWNIYCSDVPERWMSQYPTCQAAQAWYRLPWPRLRATED